MFSKQSLIQQAETAGQQFYTQAIPLDKALVASRQKLANVGVPPATQDEILDHMSGSYRDTRVIDETRRHQR
jgi:hypothetical protein